MTAVGFAVALILGALPEVVGFDPLLSYPVHQRQRHPPPPGPQVPHHLPARRRPPRTARSPPARAQPRHGGCPAGSRAVNVTALGAPCLRWADLPPLLERPPPEGWAPLRGQRHNLCRSPDGAGRPWCFYRSARGRGAGGHCGCGPGSVRLRGGRSESEGTVEVRAPGGWGTVCSSHWDDADASVVCHQLQLGRKGVAKQTPFSSLGPIPVYWSNVHCRGDEDNILQCGKDTWRDGPCPQKMAAAVTCSLSHGPASPVLRLAGGSSVHEGRVELYHAGQWGTVCDDQWDDADAEVVCRQLGLSGVARAWSRARFGEGSGPVVLDEVRCTGNELAIEQCPKSAWGEHNCEHKEDAGVSCTPLTDGVLRLAGGKDSHEGRLEVYYRGQWGTVCDDGWTELNTNVVCRQLGFKHGRRSAVHPFKEHAGPVWLDDVSCSGKESGLLQCSRRPWGAHDCSHREDVALACYLGGEGHRPTLGFPIRLVDGENKKEGRVEVFIKGQWGTVCDDGWTDKDAAVTCRQLGYKGPARARPMAYFGEGTGPIHVDNVRCTGTERSLADCVKQELGRHNCRHSEDAGVICDYFGKKASGNSSAGSAPARRATPSASGITTRWCRRSSRRSSGSSRSSCTQSTAWTAATATSPWSGCEGTGSAPAWAAASCRRACRSRARGRGGRPPPATSRAGATQDERIQELYSKRPSPCSPKGFVRNATRVGSQEGCSVLEVSTNTDAWTAARGTVEGPSCASGPEGPGRCTG
ncbi:neurotrypsin isoform X2 [Rousettus aegyptiacus]|uniref:neurotrypsin isoform X2 n=1 Tax=Rousettus aegyptiacus TaxID=9407 RepID=UPI00168D5EAB|nr:neurotrypsin isoform X2 [Rousettus aegyptiacus]